MFKIYTRFQTKTAQNHTLWGSIYIYTSYRGVPPPGVNDAFVMEIELVFHSVCLTFEVLFMKIPDFFNI